MTRVPCWCWAPDTSAASKPQKVLARGAGIESSRGGSMPERTDGATEDDGLTPLHVARGNGKTKVARLFAWRA